MKTFQIAAQRAEELEELATEIKELIAARCVAWEAELLLEYLLWTLREARQEVATASQKEAN